jgi:hypothetical protein
MGTGAGSRDAGCGQELRSAAGGRATSVLGSAVTDTEGAGGADGTGAGAAGSEADGRTGADAGRSCRALLSRGASWVIVASPGSGAEGWGGSAPGSDMRAALSSLASTCLRRGSKTHSAVWRRPPEVKVSWTCQLPSPRFFASHWASSGSPPIALSRSATISPSRGPGVESPWRRTDAVCAWSAM